MVPSKRTPHFHGRGICWDGSKRPGYHNPRSQCRRMKIDEFLGTFGVYPQYPLQVRVEVHEIGVLTIVPYCREVLSFLES